MSEINLTIDGLAVKAQPGQSLLLTARAQGVDIPTLCYHDDLKPDGRCRLCVVEIGEPGRTRLVNSCTYPVEEGLIVQTKSEKVLASRRLVLELLLAQARRNELLSVVQLYRALGGGWTEPEPRVAATPSPPEYLANPDDL